MTRFLKLLSTVLAGVALVYAGFYLTGLLAVHMEPKSFGLTARTIFVLIMFLAWGVPPAALWLAAGLTVRWYSLRWAAIGALAQICVFLAISLHQADIDTSQPALNALVSTLAWPIAFAAVFSLLGSVLGLKLRSFNLSIQRQGRNA